MIAAGPSQLAVGECSIWGLLSRDFGTGVLDRGTFVTRCSACREGRPVLNTARKPLDFSACHNYKSRPVVNTARKPLDFSACHSYKSRPVVNTALKAAGLLGLPQESSGCEHSSKAAGLLGCLSCVCLICGCLSCSSRVCSSCLSCLSCSGCLSCVCLGCGCLGP